MPMAATEVDRDEAERLRRARAGDAPAFESLYREHVGRVYAVCLRMTADPAQAEECTQRAFIQAWRRLGDFRGASRFGTWLHRIAVNEVLGSRRSANRDGALLRSVGDDGEAGDGMRNDAGIAMDLEQAIARLPERARHVFVLIAVHGYTHAEAAEMLGVTDGTCKAQYHRARGLLCEWLDAGEGATAHA